jgi:hypothetical protein
MACRPDQITDGLNVSQVIERTMERKRQGPLQRLDVEMDGV